MHFARWRITLYHYRLHFLPQYIIGKIMLYKLLFYCFILVFVQPLQCTCRDYFVTFQRNVNVEVEHVVHTTLQWVCLTRVEPIHYAQFQNTLFYLRSISHCNYIDQVVSMSSNSLLNWVSHSFQPCSLLQGVWIISIYKGWNLFSKAITIGTLRVDVGLYNACTLHMT